jgi:hypothetical protein
MEGVKAMELFGRELSLEQMVGLVECNATPDEDLVHRAALEIIAALRESQRRERAAVEDIYKMTDGGECDICKHYNPDKNTCAKPFVPYDDCFEWRGPQDEEGAEL